MWKTTNGLGQPVTWYSEATVKKLIDALKEIRELQIDCEGCGGDCMWCNNGTKSVFEEADNALKEFEQCNKNS